MTATDEIKDVNRLFRDGGDWCCKCPHCGEVIGLEGDTIEDIQGEQYQHKKRTFARPNGTRTVGCDGWMQISSTARRSTP